MELSQIPAAFHSKLRLAVIAALLSGPKNFRVLQDLTGATPGNLGKQLEVLEAEGYLRSEKAFVGRRPNTTYTLLPYGREQFAQYVALLESLLAGAQGADGVDSLVTRLPWKRPPQLRLRTFLCSGAGLPCQGAYQVMLASAAPLCMAVRS
ncbi:MAG: transcriptional regulator [Evtepia sp.]